MNRYVRRGIAVMTAVIMVFLTACSGEKLWAEEKTQQKEIIKIGVSIYDEYDIFTAAIVKYLEEWCKSKELEMGAAITVEVVAANKNQLTQNDQIERFIEKEYDVICVNLVDRTNAMVIIDKAKSADIPIIFWNRELVQEDLERWDKLYYVGSVPEQSALMQAQIVTEALSDEARFAQIDSNGDGVIQYVMLEGERGHQDALVRTQVSVEEIKKAGFQVEKLGDEFANWNRAQATTKMNEFLDKYPWQIEMVIANDDNMALGAIDALEQWNPNQWPLIVGVNGQSDALEMIRCKKMEGTVYHDAKGQGEAMAMIAYALANEETIPDSIELQQEKYVYTSYQIINYDNVQEYLERKLY